MKKILAADIGGTNSRFAFFAGDGGRLELRETVWLKTTEADSFGALLEMLRESRFALRPEDADIAAVAVAGPVQGGMSSAPPYIAWSIDVSRPADFGLRRCLLINDFVAQAYACRTAPGEAADPVLPGTPVEGAAVAVIGAGTGLGMAAIFHDGRGGLVALPSEGGHANFPFVSKEEYAFQEFVLGELGGGYVTGNDILSGRGLSYLHKFHHGEDLPAEEVARALTVESLTATWMARFYGRGCRNLALYTLSQGGLYIAGGVAAKSPVIVKHPAFAAEFRNSPKHAALLAGIPVYLITDEQSGLWGAAYMGLMELRKGPRR